MKKRFIPVADFLCSQRASVKIYVAHYHREAPMTVAEWSACWTQAQKGLGSNRSRDAVG